jgi:hypothetical protein
VVAVNRGAIAREQILYAQFFNGNQTVPIDQSSGELVNKIMATIPDSFVDARQNLVRLAAGVAPLRGLRLLTGGFRKCLFVSAEETWIGDKRAVRKGGKLIQSNVDSDRLRRRGKRFRFILTGKAGEPLSRKTAQRLA